MDGIPMLILRMKRRSCWSRPLPSLWKRQQRMILEKKTARKKAHKRMDKRKRRSWCWGKPLPSPWKLQRRKMIKTKAPEFWSRPKSCHNCRWQIYFQLLMNQSGASSHFRVENLKTDCCCICLLILDWPSSGKFWEPTQGGIYFVQIYVQSKCSFVLFRSNGPKCRRTGLKGCVRCSELGEMTVGWKKS